MNDDEKIKSEFERMLIKPQRAAQMLDVSRATIYRMLASGELEKVILPGGRLIRVPLDAIRKLREGDPADTIRQRHQKREASTKVQW